MLIESQDMDFVLNNLLLITMGKLMVSRGMIIIYQPATDNYIVSKSKGRNCPDEGQTLSFDWDKEIKEQSVIRCGIDDFDMPEIIERDKHCTFFNLRTSNNHIGFLCLGSKGNKQPLSEREIEFIESLSIISSVAIANSRMFTELRRINRMLDRKVYELNTLFDLSKDFNIMVDRDEIVRIFKFAMLGQMLIRKFFFVLENEGQREMVASSGIQGSLSSEQKETLFSLEDDLVEVDEELEEEVLEVAGEMGIRILGPNCQGVNNTSNGLCATWPFITETPSDELLFAIGDVTGKGIPAALLMANLQAMLHVLLPIDISLSKASEQINDIIHQNTPSDKFITFFWGIFNPDSAEFRFVNAGHNPPIWLKNGQDEPEELEEGGLILGAIATMTPYEEQTIQLSTDDVLVFYTDGVTEALNEDETEEFGEERLINCIRENRNKSSKEIEQAIIETVKQYSHDIQYDDITLIVLKVN